MKLVDGLVKVLKQENSKELWKSKYHLTVSRMRRLHQVLKDGVRKSTAAILIQVIEEDVEWLIKMATEIRDRDYTSGKLELRRKNLEILKESFNDKDTQIKRERMLHILHEHWSDPIKSLEE